MRGKDERFEGVVESDRVTKGAHRMSLLWIILIVVLVLALLGFFGRGRF